MAGPAPPQPELLVELVVLVELAEVLLALVELEVLVELAEVLVELVDVLLDVPPASAPAPPLPDVVWPPSPLLAPPIPPYSSPVSPKLMSSAPVTMLPATMDTRAASAKRIVRRAAESFTLSSL